MDASAIGEASTLGTIVLRDFLRTSKHAPRLPEVNGERCVHTRLEVATCARCVDACPNNAWILDDEQLGLVSDVCDGCGLCATACSEGAITPNIDLDMCEHKSETIALAACDRADTSNPDQSGRVPCVHAIGLSTLVTLYTQGVRRILTSRGDCSTCPRSGRTDFNTTIESLNRVLSDRGLTEITLVTLPSLHWAGAKLVMSQRAHHGDGYSRRDFFRNLAAMFDERQHDTDRDAKILAEPPGHLLPRQNSHDLMFFVPSINADKCEGCDACIHVCNYGAIALSADDDAYAIYADNCTGCRLCMDICNTNAINVSQWSRQYVPRIELERYRCTGCGAPFHWPRNSQASGNELCNICAATGHCRKLYQVLD